jgi:hypothetical protein
MIPRLAFMVSFILGVNDCNIHHEIYSVKQFIHPMGEFGAVLGSFQFLYKIIDLGPCRNPFLLTMPLLSSHSKDA